MEREDFRWFKETFHASIARVIAGTPFSMDLIAAIAAQETGGIWSRLRHTLSVDEILEICVGDTLDADRGRRAFPRTKADLVSAPRGAEMFQIAREALVKMSAHVPGFASVARRPHKFCHGFGIFQYDLQFFSSDPDYFIERRWQNFDASLAKCMEELEAAQRRAGMADRPTLSDLEKVHVAIAYNAGSFKPAKGLKQGHFDGERYYGERIFDFLRIAQTVSTHSSAALRPEPAPGTAAIPMPTALDVPKKLFEVDVEVGLLRLRSTPKVEPDERHSNIVARLPDGHWVSLLSGEPGEAFFEIETSLNGAYLRGFAAARFLRPLDSQGVVPVVVPAEELPTAGIVAAHAPRKSTQITRRAALAGAHSLNEPGQPRRNGTTPQELRNALAVILDYLAVDKASHRRYQPRDGATFCNIYAHDYCHLAGVYLPRVWWTADAIERLARSEVVEPRLGSTIDEQRANDLFRWLRAFGARFGWRQTGTLTKLQTEVNVGAIGLICAIRRENGRPGHLAVVVPEMGAESARRDASGGVIAPLQSQAGSRNFRHGTGTLNWWKGDQFSDNGFWIHA